MEWNKLLMKEVELPKENQYLDIIQVVRILKRKDKGTRYKDTRNY